MGDDCTWAVAVSVVTFALILCALIAVVDLRKHYPLRFTPLASTPGNTGVPGVAGFPFVNVSFGAYLRFFVEFGDVTDGRLEQAFRFFAEALFVSAASREEGDQEEHEGEEDHDADTDFFEQLHVVGLSRRLWV